MKTTIKKISALCMSIVIVASTLSVSASAYGYSASWSTRRVNAPGAPTSASQSDQCSIIYSTYGAAAYCNSSDHEVNGAIGTTVVTSVNGTMEAAELIDIDSVVCAPVITGVIECSTFYFISYTSEIGDTFTASGNIVTKTEP